MSAKTELRLNIRGIDQTAGAIRSVLGGFNSMAMKAGAMIGGIFAAHKLMEGGKAIFESMHEISAGAMKAGLSAAAFQDLGDVFKLVGADSAAMVKTFQMMQKNLSGGKVEAIEKLGLDVQALKQMRPDEAFKTIGQAISALPTESDRAAAAMMVFGRSSGRLLPLFRQGPETFKEGLTAIADMLPNFSGESLEFAKTVDLGFKAIGQTLKVDLVDAFMTFMDAGSTSAENVGIKMFECYARIKEGFLIVGEVVKGVFTALYNWAKPVIDWLVKKFSLLFDKIKTFANDVILVIGDVSGYDVKGGIDKIKEDTEKSIAAFKNSFQKGMEFKHKISTPIDAMNESVDRLKIKLAEVKTAVSDFGKMGLAGTYAAIQSQYGGLMPAVAGTRGKDPFSDRNGGQALLEKLYQEMKKVAKNTETTADNLEFEEI